ncbi:MAG: hypothetical protein V3T15_10060, partial [Pseudomonadales bacterium]
MCAYSTGAAVALLISVLSPNSIMAAPAAAFEDVRFLGLATFDKLRVTDVAFLPSGELLVLDGSAAKVYVFGNNGEFRA